MELKQTLTISETAITYANISQAGLTPVQLATAYNMPANNGAGVKIGIFSLGGGWLQTDLNSSMTAMGITPPNITTVLVDGATNNFSNNLNDIYNISPENTLDLYCIAGIVPGANIVIYIGQGNTTAGWVNVLNRMIDDNCDIISMSYAIDEAQGYGDFLSIPLSRAAARGITVLAASGDWGSEGNQDIGMLSAGYPATSPNVIAVGGTTLALTSGNLRATETTSIRSGGGISSKFNLPIWQQGLTYSIDGRIGMVELTELPRLLGTRGVPDISAHFGPYGLYFGGNIIQLFGTSASTPILAGMVARFISASGRRPPALNTIFYSNTSAFNDISGGNNDLAPLPNGLYYGYAATPGWDPVTGLGSPNGQALYNVIYPNNITVKDNTGTWAPVANVLVKTGSATWARAKAVWAKTATGWKSVA